MPSTGSFPRVSSMIFTFVGMQRAFNVHVSADWEQVYHFLDEKTSVEFSSSFNRKIENVVSEMIEKKIIKIEASLKVSATRAWRTNSMLCVRNFRRLFWISS